MAELKNRITVEMTGSPQVVVKAIIKSTDDAVMVVNAILRANDLLFEKEIVFGADGDDVDKSVSKAA